ncbi:MAG: sugar-binding protein [Propionibacteriaceae bacterium]|jgi:putative multiple sugar transport system substrate-binding protein|nr:sugar-binding protein [Propionibacteriaceae bacterium]
MKRNAILGAALALTAGLLFSSCGTTESGGGGTTTPAESESASQAAGFAADATIGVALPQKTSENWVRAEDMFNEGLAAAGFNKIVQFADNGVTEQQSQISAMVEQDAKVIVVGAIDGSQLGDQLASAKAKGAYIIAYDRLLKNTDAVDLYVAYDPYRVGELQGQALIDGLTAKGCKPCNIELIAGSADDANSTPFFEGAMSKLQPKIDAGDYVVRSGQTSFTQVATEGWLAQNAQTRFDNLLAANYADATLDGVLSPNDTLARAALTAVDSAGKPGIIITGQDSEVESIKLILDGKQYSTINKDTGVLVNKVIEIIKGLQAGTQPTTNGDPLDNGVIKVPVVYLDPVIVTKDNICTAYTGDTVVQKVLDESGKC